MNYSDCRRCGKPGHWERDCAEQPAPAHYGWDPYKTRRSAEAQERINIRGGMKIRAAAAGDWELLERIDSVRCGDADEADCTAELQSAGT